MLITSHYYYSIRTLYIPDWLVNCIITENFEIIGVGIKCHAMKTSFFYCFFIYGFFLLEKTTMPWLGTKF